MNLLARERKNEEEEYHKFLANELFLNKESIEQKLLKEYFE